MKTTSNPIVFFGNERIATGVSTTAPTLRKLVQHDYNISLVVANDEGTISRKQRELEIASVAREYNIPIVTPKRLGDIKDQLQATKATAGVLVAYGKMVPQSIIDIFPYGIANIHPSLLPLHRGPTPLESVILSGSQETGVSIMKLVKAMDAGPVYAQKKVALMGSETKQELADRLLNIGGDMLLECLPSIMDGTAKTISQDENKATYDNLIAKNDGIIAWQESAQQIEREIRAYAIWPKSKATIAGREVVITKAHVVNLSGVAGKFAVHEKQLVAFCGSNALVIDALMPSGKQEMTGQSFLAGYKQFL